MPKQARHTLIRKYGQLLEEEYKEDGIHVKSIRANIFNWKIKLTMIFLYGIFSIV